MRNVPTEILEDIKNKKEFVRILAKRIGFTNIDVEIVLNEMIKMFEEATDTKKEIRIRGFGNLYHQVLPERYNGLTGTTIPQSYRTAFRLASNIRAGGVMYVDEEDLIDEEET